MENNALLISAYVTSTRSGQPIVYRNYYINYNGVYTPVKIDTTLDFIKDNVKKCNTYDYDLLKDVIKGVKKLDDIEPISYKDYCIKYGVR